MHCEGPRNLSQSATVQIIRCQDESILGREAGQNVVGGGFNSGINHGGGLGISSGELRAVFALFVQADQAALTAKAVHELLRHHGAQPAF